MESLRNKLAVEGKDRHFPRELSELCKEWNDQERTQELREVLKLFQRYGNGMLYAGFLKGPEHKIGQVYFTNNPSFRRNAITKHSNLLWREKVESILGNGSPLTDKISKQESARAIMIDWYFNDAKNFKQGSTDQVAFRKVFKSWKNDGKPSLLRNIDAHIAKACPAHRLQHLEDFQEVKAQLEATKKQEAPVAKEEEEGENLNDRYEALQAETAKVFDETVQKFLGELETGKQEMKNVTGPKQQLLIDKEKASTENNRHSREVAADEIKKRVNVIVVNDQGNNWVESMKKEIHQNCTLDMAKKLRDAAETSGKPEGVHRQFVHYNGRYPYFASSSIESIVSGVMSGVLHSDPPHSIGVWHYGQIGTHSSLMDARESTRASFKTGWCDVQTECFIQYSGMFHAHKPENGGARSTGIGILCCNDIKIWDTQFGGSALVASGCLQAHGLPLADELNIVDTMVEIQDESINPGAQEAELTSKKQSRAYLMAGSDSEAGSQDGSDDRDDDMDEALQIADKEASELAATQPAEANSTEASPTKKDAKGMSNLSKPLASRMTQVHGPHRARFLAADTLHEEVCGFLKPVSQSVWQGQSKPAWKEGDVLTIHLPDPLSDYTTWLLVLHRLLKAFPGMEIYLRVYTNSPKYARDLQYTGIQLLASLLQEKKIALPGFTALETNAEWESKTMKTILQKWKEDAPGLASLQTITFDDHGMAILSPKYWDRWRVKTNLAKQIMECELKLKAAFKDRMDLFNEAREAHLAVEAAKVAQNRAKVQQAKAQGMSLPAEAIAPVPSGGQTPAFLRRFMKSGSFGGSEAEVAMEIFTVPLGQLPAMEGADQAIIALDKATCMNLAFTF